MATKITGLLVYNVAWAEAYSVPSGILIHPTVWPQYTNVSDTEDRDRTDNGPIAKGEPLVAQKRQCKIG